MTADHCPACGAVRPLSPAGELCLACLLALGLDGAPTAPAVPPRAGAGDVPPSWRALALLGGTGRTTVYLAEEAASRRLVAVKVLGALAPGEGARVRFLREIEALGTLRHPNIASVLGGGITPAGRPYVVSELLAGVPIDRHCRPGCPLAVRLSLMAGVCRGLAHAHERGLAHGHVAAPNVLVASDSPTPTARLTDFGQAGWRGDRCDAAGDIADAIALLEQVVSPSEPLPARLRAILADSGPGHSAGWNNAADELATAIETALDR